VVTLSGLTLSEIPAGEYFRIMKETAFMKTAGFLPHGGGCLSEALVNAIEKMGGTVWTHCPAVQIKVKDDTTTGAVVKKDNEEYEINAQAVISNAGPRRTVGLVGKEYLSSGYIKEVEAVKSVPTLRILATSDRPLIEGPSLLVFPEARRLFLAWCSSNSCPDTVPEGKHVITAFSYLTSSQPPYNFKKEIELSLQDLRDNITDFDKYAEILRIDTFHGDWGEIGTHAGYNLSVKTPIEGLYLVGDVSGPLGWCGSPAAVKSARLAIEDAIQRYKPE
jgi:phytoene dehydrogenase-like protein